MTSGGPHYGRDPSRGKGIANYQSSHFLKEKNICSNMNHDVTIDKSPLILSFAHSSNTARSPPVSTPSPSQNPMPQTKYTQQATPPIGSHTEKSSHNGPSHSADPPSSPLHIHDDVDDDTQSWDNDELDREIVGEKSPQGLTGNDTHDHQGKKMIFPDGNDFAPRQVALSAITAVIKNRYRNGLKSYGTIKKNETIHKKWFDVFRRKVEWLPQDEHLVMKIFDRKCSHRLSDMLRDARISGHRPDWIDEMAWASLQEYWSSDDFKRISQKAKRTRAFGKGGSLHIGRTMSTPENAQQMGGKDHDGIQMTKPEKYIGSVKTELHDASGNAEEGSIYITLNDSNPNYENPDQKNYNPLVPPGFETITRDTQNPQGNQQEHDSNIVKEGKTISVMVDGEFQRGFWITVKDGDSSNPPYRGMIFKPVPSTKNNELQILATMMGISAPGSKGTGSANHVASSRMNNVPYVATTTGSANHVASSRMNNVPYVATTAGSANHVASSRMNNVPYVATTTGSANHVATSRMNNVPYVATTAGSANQVTSSRMNNVPYVATIAGSANHVASSRMNNVPYVTTTTGSANHVASSRMNKVPYVATTAGPLETTKVVPVEFKASALLSGGMNQASLEKGKKI